MEGASTRSTAKPAGDEDGSASCLLDIHGQHEHQSLLYQDKQLEILDAYGKDEIYPVKEKVQNPVRNTANICRLRSLDTDERAFPWNLRSKRSISPGEDEELEILYRLEQWQKILELTERGPGNVRGQRVWNRSRERTDQSDRV